MAQAMFDISVLYVEDDAAIREEVEVFLRRRVREVLPAAHGEEGLALFRQQRPDVVITDIRMPVMDGLAMAKAIRSIEQDAHIIVTSAHSDVSFMTAAIEIGVDQYVIKPVDYDRLIAAVRKCCEAVEYRRAAKRHHEEREELVLELQAALKMVRQLSGFLPICASCKKIRDDRGYWQQIEAYIRDHSDAEFSHAICPECAKKLYPDYYQVPDKPKP